MIRIRPYLSFYVDSSIHVGLAVVSLLGITALELNSQPDPKLLLFVFCATVAGYNFVRYYRSFSETTDSLPKPNWLFWLINLLALATCAFCVFFLDPEILMVTAVLGLITLFYDFPLDKKKNLRNRSGLKILLVALVWTGVTVYPVLHEAGLELRGDVLFTIAQRFLFVILLTLPFEIRDLRKDDSGLGTLPQVLGVSGTQRFGFVLVLITVGLELAKSPYDRVHLVVLLYLVVMGYVSLLLAREDQGPYFSSFWVEGIPIVGYLIGLSLTA